jgi:hypothetical protein
MEIRALYNVLDADTRVLAIDTTGMNTVGAPVPVSSGTMRIAELTNLYTDAVLPSLNSYVLFDLSSHDGIRVGDEVEIFRARQEQYAADGPVIPEVSIARAQVVRVTPFGATARVTSQSQPAIRTGESIRVIARMP